MVPRQRFPRDGSLGGTSAAPRPNPEPSLLKYSFQHLQTDHPRFDASRKDASYFRTLLARLKDLSSIPVSEFRTFRGRTLRIHPINFADPRVSVRGFGIPKGEQFDARAWQFSVSANEHGRVHGFLIGDTFFVRWLDPDHNLYAGG